MLRDGTAFEKYGASQHTNTHNFSFNTTIITHTAMTLVKRNGFLTTLPSIFEDFFGDNSYRVTPNNPTRRWLERVQATPAVNVRESDKAFTVEVAAPGLAKEDFNVELNENVLTVSCAKQEQKEDKAEQYTRREFGYFSFKRSFALPENMVAVDKIEAKYENGILVLLLPKRVAEPQAQKRLISIA